MPARDANNSTWYVLRYAGDFTARTADGDDPAPPELDGDAVYDPDRRVLELAPADPDPRREPAPGFAAEPDGEAYRVSPGSGRLVRVRCDGVEVPLGCPAGAFVSPGGLALDRRGFLAVADPGAGRVVIVWPEDGTILGVTAGGLTDPVDVAASPCGTWLGVADKAGRIAVFDSRLNLVRTFPAKNRTGQPGRPEPIGVAFADDGTVLVIDAGHPRVLRFTLCGEPLADMPIAPAPPAPPAACAVPGCCNPPDAPPAGEPRRPASRFCRVVARHREYRLGQVAATAAFRARGGFVSAALDAGTPGAKWHKIVLEADVPPGAELVIETATADRPERLGAAEWSSPGPPFAPDVPDRLVVSPPGRFLRVRLTLRSDGTATPAVRVVRVAYPRNSWLELLPRIFARDPASAGFLERYLALFESVFTRIGDRRSSFLSHLSAGAAPPDVLEWLGCLLDLAADPTWPLARRRALVAAAAGLYRIRGTVEGVARYVEAYTGRRPEIREAFLTRPARATLLGGPGSILGCGFALQQPRAGALPDEAASAASAHHFTVFAYPDGECDRDAVASAIDRIVTVNKPAHTVHEVRVVLPGARLDANLGLDFVLGEREPPAARVGDAGGMVLGGSGAVLGNRRPGTERPPGFQI